MNRTYELLAINRRVANRTENEQQERCLLEGVHRILASTKEKPTQRRKVSAGSLVQFFRENSLRLLQADEEGMLVVMPLDCFNQKAASVIFKNFVPVKASVAKTKTEAVARSCQFELKRLAKSISRTKGNSLFIFFTAETHKEGVPFRPIVSEKRSW